MKRTTFALLSMMAASGSVLAVENWQGLYTDLRAGAGFNPGDNGELEFRRADGSDNRAAIDGAFGDNFNGEFNAGSLLGAAIGYKFQQDRWVYGAEFSLSSADLSQDQSAFSATPATYVERREIDLLTHASFNIGYASELPILPFFSLGASYGDVDYSWQGNSGAFRGDNGKDDRNIGYHVGIGVEVKLNGPLSLTFEYQYVDLGDADFSTNFSGEQDLLGQNNGAFNAFGNAASGGTNAQGSDDDFDFQTVGAALRYRF